MFDMKDLWMERMFNYQWGGTDGGKSRIFSSTDIRCGDSYHKDFTLRPSNLKEALEMVKDGNFGVALEDATKFRASGCPPSWPHSTKGLVKASQMGGTGGEDDSTTFHSRDPWKIVFMHEGQKVEWNLVKRAQPLSVVNVRDGRNEENPSSGEIKASKDFDSPKQYLSKNPLQAGIKERDRIRKAAKDSRVYLLGSPHKKSEKPQGGKQVIGDDQDSDDGLNIGENSTRREEHGLTKEQKGKERHKGRKRVETTEQNTKIQSKKAKSKYLHLRKFLEMRRQKKQKAGTLDLMAEVMMMI